MPVTPAPGKTLINRAQLTATATDLDMVIPVGSLEGLYRLKAKIGATSAATALGIQLKIGAGSWFNFANPTSLTRGIFSASGSHGLNAPTVFDAFLEVRKNPGGGVRAYQIWGRGWAAYDPAWTDNVQNWDGTTLSDSGRKLADGWRQGQGTDTIDRITLSSTLASGLLFNASYPTYIELWKIFD
jgi:hypothetical protein